MQGERAVPSLDADDLIAAVPQLAAFAPLTAETVLALAAPQIGLADALKLARRACAAGDAGDGVVITGHLLGAATDSSDGVVLVALGAGHLPPGTLHALRAAVKRVPVLITCRVERSAMLFATYGFEGAEPDVRASGAICVPFLSAAARIALLCCLGSGLDIEAIGRILAPWDARLHFGGTP